MVIVGGWVFLMSKVPLYSRTRSEWPSQVVRMWYTLNFDMHLLKTAYR